MAYQRDYSPGQGQRANYGQYNPYAQQDAQQSNPYAQQQQPGGYSQQGQEGGYGQRPDLQQQGSSNYGQTDQSNAGYEMGDLNGQAARSRNPNQILEECREIDRGIDSIDRTLDQLKGLHSQSLNATDASPNSPVNREIDRLTSDMTTSYRNFSNRMKAIKSDPESGNPRNAPQVGRVDRRLKDAIQKCMLADRDYQKRMREQFERNYRIVRPDASDSEVREATEDMSNNQVFSQALYQSDRRGQSQSALRAVQGRHEAIQKVERSIIELAQIFEDMQAAVIQQEPAVQQIEAKGEEVNDNVAKGNVEMDHAVKSARAARRKKWWCLLIVLIILIIIAVVVAVAVEVTKKN